MNMNSSFNRRTFVLGATAIALLPSTSVFAQGRGKKYAVIVGVEDYDPEELNPLRFPQRDADALAAELTRLQFDVTLMTAKAGRPQLKPNSAEKIERVLNSRSTGLTEDDTLIFAFMGHGVQFSSDKKDEVQELYFCPEDTRLNDRATLLSMNKVYQALGSSKAGRKLLLVDACRNDPQPKGKSRAKETELEPVGRAVRTVPQGMLALFSCSEGETSREYPDLDIGHGSGHGVFTYHVLKYLRGHAESTWYPQQQLTVADMAHYVSRETKDFVWSKENKDQIQPHMAALAMELGLGTNDGIGKSFVSKSTGMAFALIPKGKFTMGSPESEVGRDKNETQRKVSIDQPFYLGKFEVTQQEFQRVMGFNPSEFTDSKRLPVEQVSWFDAVWFCNKLSELDGFQACYRISQVEKDGSSIKSANVVLIPQSRGYRLPTESEWEYACRAGTQTPFSFGANISTSQVNFDGRDPYNKGAKGEIRWTTIEVDAMQANAWGLHQMHGNVWEWSEDNDDSSDAAIGSSHVFRGGSWGDSASRCRSAERTRFWPVYRISVGFRVALVPPAK